MNDAIGSKYIPRSLLIQWHITDRCNLRCRHCYQSDYRERGFSLEKLWSIAERVFEFHAQCEQQGKTVPLRFTLTGGEPFSHPDFLPLLQKLSRHPSQPSLAVLTNGSAMTLETAKFLKQINNLNFVQLSVDGNAQTHDAIRGLNNLRRVLNASEALNQAGIFYMWSFTAHSENYRQFPQVAKLAQRYKVPKLWSDRMIACRDGSSPAPLDSKQTRQWLEMMAINEQKLASQPDNQTHIAMNRALQFLYGCGDVYRCNAGDGLLTVMPDGEVYPCRRLPVSVGNLLKRSLAEIYYRDPLLCRLRGFDSPSACRTCLYCNSCKGGLRCQAYAVTGDPFNADPGCWYAEKQAD